MRVRKRNPASNPPPASRPAVPAPAAGRRSRRFWFVLGGLVLLAGLAGWGAWALWHPDPLREVHAALDRRDFRAADELLTQHLAKNPDDRAARLLAARTARRAGESGRAFDYLREYSRKYAADEAHDLELALIRVQNGNRPEAERLFAEYSAKPDSPDTPFVMEAQIEGGLRVNAAGPHDIVELEGQGPAAVVRLRTATELWLRLRPSRADQVQGLVWQGRILRFGREHEKGVAKLREALALDPDHFDARFHLALAIAEEVPEESLRHLEILAARRPDDRRVRFHFATLHRTLGHAVVARQILSEMLAVAPDELSALVELGLLDLDEGKVADAEPRLRRALELGPNLGETNVAMSRCMQLAGKPDEAAKYRKRFEEIEAERTAPRRDPPGPKKP